MPRKVHCYILHCLLFFLTIMALQGIAKPAQDKSWLRQYNEYQRYDDVYVVKKINTACRSYESFVTDASGKKLTPAYRDIGPFAEGLAEFVPQQLDASEQGLHGFINKKGEVVIQPIYTSADQFRDGKAWVIYKKGKQFGISYLDPTGQTIHEVPVEQYPRDFLIKDAEVSHVCSHDCREDVIWWKDGEIFLLNWNFSKYNEREIKSAKGIYHFNYKGKYGIIDKNMVLRVPVALDDIDPTYKFSGQGMERVQYGDKFGYISPYTGDLIVPFLYSETRKPTNGLFWVKKDGKWGAIDKTGKLHIKHLYDEATGFTAENRSAVAIRGKFGHIDKSGKVRTPLQYDFASYYHNGVSMVRIDDKYGYIDTTNKFIIPAIYDEALPFDEKTTIAERSWLRFEVSLDGSERFAGFSYKLNAVLILIAALLFVWLNSFAFQRFQKFRLKRGGSK